MRIELTGFYEEDANGNWRADLNAHVPGGVTVNKGVVIDRVLIPLANQMTPARNERILTIPEEAAAKAEHAERCRLPDGWAFNLDAPGTFMCDGVTTYRRNYVKGDLVTEAPCDAQGLALPATREALIAFEAANDVVKREPVIPEA